MRFTRNATAVAVAAMVVFAAAAPAAVAVPATGTFYAWVGTGTTGLWTDPANWSPAGVPGAADHVLVKSPSAAVCRAHVTGVPDGAQVADLTVDEAVLHGDPDRPCPSSLDGGSITVTHALTFRAGEIGTAVTIPTGATATITPGVAHDATHFGAGGLTVAGVLRLTDNTGDAHLDLTGGPGITLAAGGRLVTNGDNRLTADCCETRGHLVNRGGIEFGTGRLTLDGVTLDQDGGRISTGSSGVTIDGTGQFVWTAGTVPGGVTLATQDVLIEGPDTKSIVGGLHAPVTFASGTSPLFEAGTPTAPTTLSIGSRSTLVLAGLTGFEGDTRIVGGTVTNTGQLYVLAGTRAATITSATRLTTSGTVSVQSGTLGTDVDLTQTAGSVTVGRGATLAATGSGRLVVRGGTLGGSGRVDGNVAVTAGTVAPGGIGGFGTLTITGSLTPSKTTTFALDLGARAADRIVVGQDFGLGGTLRLTDIGQFRPALDATVTAATAGTMTGRFGCTTTIGNADQRHWVPTVSGTSLVLVTQIGAAGTC